MENSVANTNGTGEYKSSKKPRPLLNKNWSELCQEVEVPGTPKTPRTSTTPGIYWSEVLKKRYTHFLKVLRLVFFNSKFCLYI